MDDNPSDGDVVALELNKRRFPCTISFIRTEREYREAVARKDFDIILCDYKMPGFDGDRAFDLAKQQCPEIPFILVTGELGEEFVIERLRNGVTDYILKDKLARLVTAIERAVEEARERRMLREAEHSLRESEERYRKLFELSPDAIAIQVDGKFVFANPACVKLFGARDECALIGRPIIEVVHPDYRKIVAARMKTVFEGAGGTPLLEERFLRLNGETIDVEVVGASFEYGGKPAVQIVIRDITGRKQAESALHQSEEKFSKAFRGSTSAMALTRLRDGMFIDVNDRWVELSGFARDETIGRTSLEINIWKHAADRSAFVHDLEQFGTIHDREYLFVRKNGEEWSGMVSAQLNTLTGEQVVISSLLDITERSRQERELQEMSKTLRALSKCDQAMLRDTDEATFLRDVCNIIVKDCGFAMVWIGYAENDEAKSVRPVCSAGFEEGYLETIRVTWSDTERGRGPTGTAIRTGQPSFCRNMLTDPKFAPWREEALKRGYASSGVFPIMSEETAIGSLTIYSRKPDAFSPGEIQLLTELTKDVSVGILALRTRAAREQAEEALRTSEAKYRTIVETAGEGIIIAQPDGLYTFVNQQMADMLGYPVSELIGRTSRDLMYDERESQILEVRSEVSRRGASRGEFKFRRRDGAPLWTLYNATPLFNDAGQHIGILAMHTDIGRMKEVEEALRRSEEKFSEAFRGSTSAMTITRLADGYFIDVNDQALALTGFTREEVLGSTSLLRHIWKDPGDRTRWVKDFEREGRLDFREYQFLKKNGEEWTALISAQVTMLRGEKVLITSLLDVTERKRYEEYIRQRQEQFANIIGSAMDAVITIGEDQRIILFNAAAEKMFGISSKEAMGEHIERFIPPRFRAVHGNNIRQFGATHATRRTMTTLGTISGTRATGEEFPIEASISQTEVEGRKLFTVILRDITERVNAEQELRANEERLRQMNVELEERVRERTNELTAANKELEGFTYSVSHDLKAPLRAISGYAKILSEDARLRLNEEDQRYLRLIVENARHLSTLVEELLTFSRLNRQPVAKRRANVKEIVERAVAAQQETTPGRSIEITIGTLPDAFADPTFLRQVVENLISNAFKYTRKQKRARIEVGSMEQKDERVYYVKDNGVGFNMEYYDKLFGVFQRLHDGTEYEGTGVGLAFCKRIIERHGGRIWGEGEQDKGATFYFSLPVEK